MLWQRATHIIAERAGIELSPIGGTRLPVLTDDGMTLVSGFPLFPIRCNPSIPHFAACSVSHLLMIIGRKDRAGTSFPITTKLVRTLFF